MPVTLHPYCVLAGNEAPETSLRGLEGARVVPLSIGSLTVWVSELASLPERSLESLRAHDAVIRAAGERGSTPLPVRFGSWADAEGLTARLREREEDLRNALERVAGAEEYGIRIFDGSRDFGQAPPEGEGPNEGDSPSGPGTRYIQTLARRRAERSKRMERAGRLAAELRGSLGALVRDERVEQPEGPAPSGGKRLGPGLMAVSHLVARDDAGAYATALDAFRTDHPGLRVVCTGPWAPYSFGPEGPRMAG